MEITLVVPDGSIEEFEKLRAAFMARKSPPGAVAAAIAAAPVGSEIRVRAALPRNSVKHIVAERDIAWEKLSDLRGAWRTFIDLFKDMAWPHDDDGKLCDVMTAKPENSVEFDGELLDALRAVHEASHPAFDGKADIRSLPIDTLVAHWRADHDGHCMSVGLITEAMEGLVARIGLDKPPAV